MASRLLALPRRSLLGAAAASAMGLGAAAAVSTLLMVQPTCMQRITAANNVLYAWLTGLQHDSSDKVLCFADAG